MMNESKTDNLIPLTDRQKDAARRAEAISAIVDNGRAAGHKMGFAARVAAAYAEAAKGGAR